MMEPWQDTTPAPGTEHLCARFVCRVSGASTDPVDALRAPRTLEALARLDELEARLNERRETVSQLLFQAIGTAQDKPSRNRLITLKRELYNLRPLSQPKLEEGLALLEPAAATEARRLAEETAERAGLEEEVRRAYGEETGELRTSFRRLLRDADFRKGLMISSRALHAALERYAAAGPELSGKEEKTERGLLRYYTRMAMKATPFSSFCAIIPGAFVDEGTYQGEGIFRFEGDPRTKRSFVRVNKTLYGILLDHLKERPGVRRALEVELNPTLRGEGGRLVYLTALQGREVFQRLNQNEVLELIVARFRERTAPTLGDLIAALSADPQIEATPEEAEAYLDKLIEIGFLRFHTGIREQDADWDVPFRALLDRIDDEHARRSSELLRGVREKTDAYGGADVEERARIIDAMHASINEAFEEMEVKGRLRRDMPFYEDATAGARAQVPLTAPVRQAVDAFAKWARLTVRLAWPRAEQATMRHFFDTYYTEARSVPLLQFYEDFYREHFKSHVEKEAKVRAGVQDEELKGYNVGNPYELEFVTRLAEARNRLTEVVAAKWRENPEAEEIAFSPSEVEEALRGVETTSAVCRSMGAFACLVPPAGDGDAARLLLQGSSYTAGYGKYFSRFLYMLPDDMQESVRKDNAGLTQELLAEICGDAQFNANLHPPLLRWEISYPTGESGNAEEQLRSSALVVEVDPEDPHALMLRHAPTGKRVVPVDLGFLNPRMRPPLYQLLSRFTPPVTFGPVLPESPNAPKREEKKPEAADVAAVEQDAAPQDAVEAAAPAEAGPLAAESPAEGVVVVGESAAPPAPAPKIQSRPRIVFDGTLVLTRRRWTIPGTLFPQRGEHESAADFFVRASRWRREAGLPETVYLRINPLPEPRAAKPGEEPQAEAPAPEPEIPGYEAPPAEEPQEEEAAPAAEGGEGAAAEGEEGKTPAAPRTQGSRDLFKPQFMDFADPLLVGLLGKMAVNLKHFNVTAEERLPARDDLPLHDGERYATEVVVQLYFPEGTIPAAAGAAEEDHAVVA